MKKQQETTIELVTTTTTATDSATAGSGFAGEPHVFGHHAADWIAICAHDRIGQRAAIPRVDVRAAGTQCGNGENEK